MLQDIHPHHIDMTFTIRPPEEDDLVVVLREGKMLLLPADGEEDVPTYGMLRENLPKTAGDIVYLFSVAGRAVYFHDGEPGEIPGAVYRELSVFRNWRPGWRTFAAVTGSHLGLWYAGNRYCGACGAPMRRKVDERAMECGACGTVVYPRISPAVIVGVVNGDRIIMTRYANRPGARFGALIAGFMEVGETLEDTVRREVFEEVGVKVKNIRYYKSQPWAFSGSVLMGFYADLDGADEITMDTFELQEARWIRREDLEPNPDAFSLTAEMIEMFRLCAMP